MINIDKEKKIIKIGFGAEEKEDHIQRWTFIQIYKPTKTNFISKLPKEHDNIFEMAFNAR